MFSSLWCCNEQKGKRVPFVFAKKKRIGPNNRNRSPKDHYASFDMKLDLEFRHFFDDIKEAQESFQLDITFSSESQTATFLEPSNVLLNFYLDYDHEKKHTFYSGSQKLWVFFPNLPKEPVNVTVEARSKHGFTAASSFSYGDVSKKSSKGSKNSGSERDSTDSFNYHEHDSQIFTNFIMSNLVQPFFSSPFSSPPSSPLSVSSSNEGTDPGLFLNDASILFSNEQEKSLWSYAVPSVSKGSNCEKEPAKKKLCLISQRIRPSGPSEETVVLEDTLQLLTDSKRY